MGNLKNKLKKKLGKKQLENFKRARYQINLYLDKLVLKSNIILRLSLMFSDHYFREHKFYLIGSIKYRSNPELSQFYLTRNTHRIEKGLLMKERRKVFALSYIYSTVLSYINIKNSATQSQKELIQWTSDVLEEYFSACESNDRDFLRARNLYNSESLSKTEKFPYNFKQDNTVSLNNLKSFAQNRKSVRWFYSTPVEVEKIKKALEVASLSPSSCNRQSYKYHFYDKEEKVKRIAAISAGTVGWGQNVPSIVVLTGFLESFPSISNRHSIYIDATLSVMPFIFALQSQGLSTCIINWSDIKKREKEMSEAIDLEPGERVILSIAIGYGDTTQKVAYSQRKHYSQISNLK